MRLLQLTACNKDNPISIASQHLLMVEFQKQGVRMPKVLDETKIFKAALETLVSHGYEGATTKKIVDMAQVNEVTLFRRFGSKAGLFEKVIEHRLSDTPLHGLVYTGDLEADLLAIVEAYAETSEIYGDIIPIILVELPCHPDLQKSFNTPWKNIQAIVRIIDEYQKRGRIRIEFPVCERQRPDRPDPGHSDAPTLRS